MTGTPRKLHGQACQNPSCDAREKLVFWGLLCELCGAPLRPASVVVGEFTWDEDDRHCKQCAWSSPDVSYCIRFPPDRLVGYPPCAGVCEEYLLRHER